MNKIEKTKSNKNFRLVIFAIILSIIIALSMFAISIMSVSETLPGNDTATENIESKNSYVPINNDELIELLERNGTAFIYIGRETCPHCAKFSPILREVLSENNVLVFYYDTTGGRADDSEKMNTLMDRLGISGVPALIKVVDGVKVAALDNYESKDAIIRFLGN